MFYPSQLFFHPIGLRLSFHCALEVEVVSFYGLVVALYRGGLSCGIQSSCAFSGFYEKLSENREICVVC